MQYDSMAPIQESWRDPALPLLHPNLLVYKHGRHNRLHKETHGTSEARNITTDRHNAPPHVLFTSETACHRGHAPLPHTHTLTTSLAFSLAFIPGIHPWHSLFASKASPHGRVQGDVATEHDALPASASARLTEGVPARCAAPLNQSLRTPGALGRASFADETARAGITRCGSGA